MYQDFNRSALDIAQDNREVPGIREALAQAAAPSRYETDRRDDFADYFTMLAKDNLPLGDLPASVLWVNFMNLSRPEFGQREAVNLFIAPIAEALAHKVDRDDLEGLDRTDLFFLGDLAEKTIVSAPWLAEENRAPVQKLARSAQKYAAM